MGSSAQQASATAIRRALIFYWTEAPDARILPLETTQPETPLKLASIAFAAVFVVIVSVAGAGYLAVRGIGAVAGTALTWLEPAVRSALPAAVAPAEIQQRLDRALEVVRDGQIDGEALRDTVLWLPGALLDGRLDQTEVEVLAGKLDRVIAAPATPPQAEG